MTIKEFWNFTNEASVPADFNEVEGGNGSVSISSGHLRVDTGSNGSGDYAAAVYNTALDQSKMYVIYGEMKASGVCGAWVPNIVGLWDSSGAPTAMTAANRDAALRMWHEYQMSSGADNFDRVAGKFKNPAGAQYGWDVTGSWTNGFYNTRTYHDEGSYYRYVIVYDGTTSPARARLLLYGYTEGDYVGWNLSYDSYWVDFDTGSTDIDPADNDLWVVFGDLTNNEAKSAQVVFDFRRIMIAEIDTTNVEEFGFTNKGSGAFPQDYELFLYVNPMPDAQTLWISRDFDGNYSTGPATDSPIIALNGDDWVKDPHCHFDGTNYWLVYQRRDGVSSDSEIFVSDTSDILNGAWGNETLISSPDTGEVKHEFPWLTKYGSTWYLFYGTEQSPTDWEIQYKTSTDATPRTGWSSATTILTAGAAGKFDDGGVTGPFLIWYSGTFTGGTWYMLYQANDGTSVWRGGIAKSTTGITGAYTRIDDTNAPFDLETFATQLDGGHTDASQCTVDDTTGLNAGDFVYIDGPYGQYEVISVDSGTTFTPQIEVTEADNANVRSYSYHSIGPRLARRINGYWVVYATAFKFTGGQEAVTIYVDTTGSTDFESCSFRQLRVGDTAIDFVIPPLFLTELSNENLGGTWGELDPVAGAVVGPFPVHFRT